jgi:hypothetical protein
MSEEVKHSHAEGEEGEDEGVEAEPEQLAEPGMGEEDREDPHKDDDQVKS